ncbi:MAG: folate-binding protein, partial [Solirubrobacterales bacterium]|nr:folate-binding protein [Solirubrobacterales bacterium]
RGIISLIGPGAFALTGDEALLDVPEHTHRKRELGGISVRVIRTDVEIDLLCAASDTESVRAWAVAAGAVPVTEELAEALRVERGRPRYGLDLDDTVIPQEAGLNERAVSFTKGCYVGQETVARLYYRGKPNRQLRGLKLSAPAQTGDLIRSGEREVGHLGSVAVSPRLGAIALAIVRREVPVGATVTVDQGDTTALVVDLPFA